MSTAFFEKSKEIANSFLQSIVFLDDKAFNGNVVANSEQDSSKHAFDSFEISKAFAKEKKVCAVYNPITVSDIEDFKEISKKADVVILDWFIEVQDEITVENQAADVDEEDPRGQYTKQIIGELTSYSGSNSLKLIVIYTGEDILEEITQNIYDYVSSQTSQFELNQVNCEVSSANIRILIRAKSSGSGEETRFTQRPHLKNMILRYEDLPTFVLTELTVMTSGLLSNFALLALTSIRNNSYKILSLFSSELDAPYMGNKVMLPVQNDSEELFIKMFGDTISDLLHYASISKKIQTELIDIWIENNIANENISFGGKSIQRTKEILIALLHSPKEDIKERFDEIFDGKGLTKKEIERLHKEPKTTELFLNSDQQDKKDALNEKFAKLTHHKSLFIPKNTEPKLTLGTIIRSSSNQNNYFVCIQQRCDSVRLKKDEERKFLFLPLVKADNDKFHIITPNGDKLRLDKKSYSIKTIKFKCNCDEGEVKGIVADDGKFIFKEIYEQGDTYEWILDLKDLHSQRIVTNYVSSLSRIGLDESEWLRIAGN